MFKTFQGVTESSTNEVYLRPETAQGIFVNFKNVQRTMRKRLPLGIGQIGTPFCITYDFESEQDGHVTVRDRDTMEQTRIPIAELKTFIESKLVF
ncbi:His/Gly/Thr/Pro-type tRNA ligase C-terminal domain-containing protein, partial [Paenibacillus sp.]|jgi:glycyl-tRNA synthetase (class II)|uniref:His/Gly/Thr/Pro-type tRNA ligase C-terminal domain-containing protein n=1 Tax=Paenibacillus sp. TaxID=58172 RepID=UPI002838AE77